MRTVALAAITLVIAVSARHATAQVEQETPGVETRSVTYQSEGVELQGFLAQPAGLRDADKRPGVLVIHEWWGLNDYARQRARLLAELGYIALAVDMYGQGKATEHPEQAQEWSGQFRKNRELYRHRGLAGLEVLRQQANVDAERIAAIGYCFGGSAVLELAYQDAPLAGVVSFHGSLPMPPEGASIRPKILICHGAADTFVDDDRVLALRDALQNMKADWHMVHYGGAKHSFTNPQADKHGMQGVAYDADADRRSWQHMQMFFDELFKSSSDMDAASAE